MRSILLVIILISIQMQSQSIDSIAIFKQQLSKEKILSDFNAVFNAVLKKEVSNSDGILLLQQKLKVEFVNIESVLITYSFADNLKLSDVEKKQLEKLFVSVSNGLIKEQWPATISINKEESYLRKMARIKNNHEQLYVNLVGYKTNEYINEKKVAPLIDLFNKNTMEVLNK